jgi:hypothetical protein
MLDIERFKLLHGPYHPPRYRLGGFLHCAVRGKVKVRRIGAGRIPWPLTLKRNLTTVLWFWAVDSMVNKR